MHQAIPGFLLIDVYSSEIGDEVAGG